MGNAHSFAVIQDCLTQTQAEDTGCLVDTNFLIALTYDPHPFHEDAIEAYKALTDAKVAIYAGISTRSEFLDIQRRIIMTEALMDMIAPSSHWSITNAAKQMLRKQRLWIDTQTIGDRLPILPDSRIKECKEAFLPKRESGKSGWLEVCKFYLQDLRHTWDEASEAMGIKYIGTRESEEGVLFDRKIKWENLYDLSAKTCLSSQDGMLLNLFNSSTLPILLSADYDLAYANLAEDNKKTVLVPASLYSRKIKGLRFC